MRFHLAPLLAVLALASSSDPGYNECPSTGVSLSNPFPLVSRSNDLKPAITVANYFTIAYRNGGYKVVQNLKRHRQYILYPCGTPPPDLSSEVLPQGYQRRVFPVPLQVVAVGDTSVLGFMKALDNGNSSMGVTDRLVAVSQYAVDPCLSKAASCGVNHVVSSIPAQTPGIGATVADWHNLLNNTDAFLDFSDVDYNDAPRPYNTNKVVAFSATQEGDVLARAEWIKFLGAFFDLELEAERAFRRIKDDIEAISLSARMASTRPMVAFVSYSCDGGAAYPCTGAETFSISTAAFKVAAVESAGGFIRTMDDPFYEQAQRASYAMSTIVFTGPTYNASNDSTITAIDANRQAFLDAISDVEVLVDETYYDLASDALTSVVLRRFGLSSDNTSFPFIAKQKLFRLDKTLSQSGSDWFESAVLRADLVIKDLVKVIHPDNAQLSTYKTQYLRDMFAAEGINTLTPANCKSPFPICDDEVESYPVMPICDRATYKTCHDGTVRFLNPKTGCSAMDPCPHTGLTRLAKILIGALVPVGALLVVWTCHCMIKCKEDGREERRRGFGLREQSQSFM